MVTYHPGLPNIEGILRESTAIKDVPMMAFRRPKSLQDYLVRAKLRPLVQNPGGNRGTHKCTSDRCDVCNYLAVGDSFSSHCYGHKLHCKSSIGL